MDLIPKIGRFALSGSSGCSAHNVRFYNFTSNSIENELWKSFKKSASLPNSPLNSSSSHAPHLEVKVGIIHLVRFHVNLTELQNEVRLYLNLARFARIVVNTD